MFLCVFFHFMFFCVFLFGSSGVVLAPGLMSHVMYTTIMPEPIKKYFPILPIPQRFHQNKSVRNFENCVFQTKNYFYFFTFFAKKIFFFKLPFPRFSFEIFQDFFQSTLRRLNSIWTTTLSTCFSV
jgi:hypothetical protein